MAVPVYTHLPKTFTTNLFILLKNSLLVLFVVSVTNLIITGKWYSVFVVRETRDFDGSGIKNELLTRIGTEQHNIRVMTRQLW